MNDIHGFLIAASVLCFAFTAQVQAQTCDVTSNGVLLVLKEVQGIGRWELIDHENAVIQINADCAHLTGEVWLQKGLLKVEQDFITSGKLKMESISGSTPSIEVSANTQASFDN